MFYQFLKYINVRLTTALLFTFFFSYPALFVCHNLLYVEQDTATAVLFGVLLISLVLPWSIDFLGAWRFNYLFNRLSKKDISKGIFPQIRRYERLVRLASSFYFFPTKGRRLIQKAYEGYASFYLKLNVQTREAGDILEQAFSSLSGNARFRGSLMEIFSRQERLNRQEFEIAKKIALMDKDDNLKGVEVVVKALIDRREFDMETETLFLKAVRADLPIENRVFKFVLSRLLDMERYDDFAAEFYLNACYKYGFRDARLASAMDKIANEFQALGRNDVLAGEIYEVIQSIPKDKRLLSEELTLDMTGTLMTGRPGKIIGRGLKVIGPLAGKAGKGISGAVKGLALFSGRLFSRLKETLGEAYMKIPPGARRNLAWFLLSLVVLIPLAVVSFKAMTAYNAAGPEASLMSKEAVPYSSTRKFTVQVAAFKTREEAALFMKSLIKAGESPYWVESPGKAYSIKVRVGRFDTKKGAKKYAKGLIEQGKISDYFVSNFVRGFIYRGVLKKENQKRKLSGKISPHHSTGR